MSKWGFGYSAEVVELLRDCFQRIRSFLRLEIKFTYRTSSRRGNIRRGQIAKLFTNLPIFTVFTVFQIFTDNSRSASTPSDIHNLVSISETFLAQFFFNKVFNNCDQYIRRCSQSKNSQTIFSEFKILSTNPVDVLCQPDMK